MKPNKKIIPYRIKEARRSRGLSVVELASRLDVTRQAVSQYELGKIEPSIAILNALSSVLKYPTDFFYKEMVGYESAESAVFFRSLKTTKVKNYEAAKSKISIFKEIHSYFKNYIDFPEPNFPKLEYENDPNGFSNDDIENYTNILRDYWELGDGPISNLTGVLESNGVIFSGVKLQNSKIDGFSIWYDKTPLISICTDKESSTRMRFSSAHELCHLLFHTDHFNQDDLKGDVYNRIEDEANRFAAALLLPEKLFCKDVFSSSIDHFIQLKAKWKVSISTLIKRCETLGLLSDNQIKYLKNQMTSRVYWHKEPLDDVIPFERPVAHKQAVELLLSHKVKTPYHIVSEICLHHNEIEEYCFLDKDTLADKVVSNIIQLKRV